MVTHFERSEWSLYIENKLSAPKRALLEEHLYACEHCLHLYMEEMERLSGNLPLLADESLFTEHVQQAISTLKSEQMPAARRSVSRQTVLHYAAAAAVTLLLTGGGVFQQMYHQSAQWSHVASIQESNRLTDKLMKKATDMLDVIHVPGEREVGK